MKRLIFGLLILLAAHTVAADTLRIAVAANFRQTLAEIAAEFETASSHQVILSGASTGQLYAQIINGAPFDLFFAADSARPAALESKGYAHERFSYASGRLSLCSTMTTIPADIGAWLSNADIKWLAMGNPRLSPYGKAAAEVIQATATNERLAGKIVQGENINQVYQFVMTANVTAGFIADAQRLATSKQAALNCQLVPARWYEAIIQQAVILKDGTAAEEFINFVRSPAIATIINNAGYDLPELEPSL
jgi:molybdate transport system substrate-binding protein